MSSESNQAPPLHVPKYVVAALNSQSKAIDRRVVVVIAVLFGQSLLAVLLIGTTLIVAGGFPTLTPTEHFMCWLPAVYTIVGLVLALVPALGAGSDTTPPPLPSAGAESDWVSWREKHARTLQTSIRERSGWLRVAVIFTGTVTVLDSLAMYLFVGALA